MRFRHKHTGELVPAGVGEWAMAQIESGGLRNYVAAKFIMDNLIVVQDVKVGQVYERIVSLPSGGRETFEIIKIHRDSVWTWSPTKTGNGRTSLFSKDQIRSLIEREQWRMVDDKRDNNFRTLTDQLNEDWREGTIY